MTNDNFSNFEIRHRELFLLKPLPMLMYIERLQKYLKNKLLYKRLTLRLSDVQAFEKRTIFLALVGF